MEESREKRLAYPFGASFQTWFRKRARLEACPRPKSKASCVSTAQSQSTAKQLRWGSDLVWTGHRNWDPCQKVWKGAQGSLTSAALCKNASVMCLCLECLLIAPQSLRTIGRKAGRRPFSTYTGRVWLRAILAVEGRYCVNRQTSLQGSYGRFSTELGVLVSAPSFRKKLHTALSLRLHYRVCRDGWVAPLSEIKASQGCAWIAAVPGKSYTQNSPCTPHKEKAAIAYVAPLHALPPGPGKRGWNLSGGWIRGLWRFRALGR